MHNLTMHLTALGLACASSTVPATAQALALELVQSDFEKPIFATAPPADTGRLFVAEQHTGRIRILDLATNEVLAVPFLQLPPVHQSGHTGVLGMAFHTDYANNGRFFVSYIDAAFSSQLVEYHVSADPDVAEPAAVQTIFSIAQPDQNHNGGCVQFRADGMLYMSLGDGGPSSDPMNRAQDTTHPFGSLLRFDVDVPAPFIPADNPFVGGPGHDAIWSYGLRSPWRFSFDRANGDMYLGDVGQARWEEIDYQPGTSTGGENYGWKCREASEEFEATSCPGTPLVDPIHEYFHDFGKAVIGGYVYRGSAIPGLEGTYLYGEFIDQELWSFRYDGTNLTELVDHTPEVDPTGTLLEGIASFGEDAAGELYVLTRGGRVFRIVEGCGSFFETYCVTSPNASGPGAVLSAAGSLSVGGEIRISVLEANPDNFGIFFYGTEPLQSAQGNGVLCIDPAGGTHRIYPVIPLDPLGSGRLPLDFSSPPLGSGPGQVLPGGTYYFQFWYRDPGGPGPTDYNYSDGLMGTFCL